MPTREAARKLIECCQSRRKESSSTLFCLTKEVANHIGSKWNIIILVSLSQKPKRFGELGREITGIAPRVLTQALRDLEEDGLIKRVVFPTKPPSVEYSLTKLGESLLVPVWELVNWADAHHSKILAAKQRSRSAEK